MKNLTSSLNFCRGPKFFFSNTATKALSLRDIHSSLFLVISPHYNHVGTKGQLINLLHNDVKNLTSILSCCIGPKYVSSNNGT